MSANGLAPFFYKKEVAGFHWVHVPPPLRIRESVKINTT
ncbi:hypothetical protein BN1326_90025 [Staphylococcus argenteus]|uniref:Uncharacterized protein n=1 Tax=Staphylococcus argenteus TaxID=985002 RepID=A0A7U7PYL8_9STAP|nr:hypothetical protein BN1326_90025 [Staphylococcus argenteus]CRI29274.1 hypothetical protein BN1326_90025 [Staphylococcus argenteus]